jgi:hypothetical protein
LNATAAPTLTFDCKFIAVLSAVADPTAPCVALTKSGPPELTVELSAMLAMFSALTTFTATAAATLTLLDPFPPVLDLLVLSALFTLELAEGSVPTLGLALCASSPASESASLPDDF